MLVVAPPVNEVVQEHMALCLALRLPFFVVTTKVDLRYCDLRETLSQLENIARLQGCNNNFVVYCNSNEVAQNNAVDTISVFAVSCVTGEGLDDLTRFIRDLSPLPPVLPDSDTESCLFQIDETFRYLHLKYNLFDPNLQKVRLYQFFFSFSY